MLIENWRSALDKGELQSTPVIVDTPRDRDLVSVIARVRDSGVREQFYFKPYLQKGVTCVFIFINSSTYSKRVVVGHTLLSLSRIVSSFLKRANHKTTVENGSIEELAWD